MKESGKAAGGTQIEFLLAEDLEFFGDSSGELIQKGANPIGAPLFEGDSNQSGFFEGVGEVRPDFPVQDGQRGTGIIIGPEA